MWEDLKEQIIDLYCEGKAPLQIAAELGCSIKFAQKECTKYGQDTKRQRESWIGKHGWDWKFREKLRIC